MRIVPIFYKSFPIEKCRDDYRRATYSPRWGHEDTYRVDLSRDFMEIKMQARCARAEWKEDHDPEWSGEPLARIFVNDSITPPHNVQDLFEYAWMRWRDGQLNDAQVSDELHELETWLNTITKAKPRTDFWSGYF